MGGCVGLKGEAVGPAGAGWGECRCRDPGQSFCGCALNLSNTAPGTDPKGKGAGGGGDHGVRLCVWAQSPGTDPKGAGGGGGSWCVIVCVAVTPGKQVSHTNIQPDKAHADRRTTIVQLYPLTVVRAQTHAGNTPQDIYDTLSVIRPAAACCTAPKPQQTVDPNSIPHKSLKPECPETTTNSGT